MLLGIRFTSPVFISKWWTTFYHFSAQKVLKSLQERENHISLCYTITIHVFVSITEWVFQPVIFIWSLHFIISAPTFSGKSNTPNKHKIWTKQKTKQTIAMCRQCLTQNLLDFAPKISQTLSNEIVNITHGYTVNDLS